MHRPNERGKVTRACVDAQWAEVQRTIERAPRPTAKQRREAAQACGSRTVAATTPAREVPPWGVAGFLATLTVVAIVLMLLVAGGCVPMEAVEQAREEHAINLGHALDESLPIEARQIGADGARAWSAQHRALAGDDLPLGVLPPELAPVGGGE